MKRLLLAYEEVVFRLQSLKTHNTDEALVRLFGRMERDGYTFQGGRFNSDRLLVRTVQPGTLLTLSEEAIAEQIERARTRLETGEYADAIIYSFTIVEQTAKLILRGHHVDFKQEEGDIRKLYQLVATQLNLNPGAETIDRPLKPILEGLQKVVAGLYEVANKASNRHARRYNPARHHAALAVNAAFAICDFLVESELYQRQRQRQEN